MAAGKSGMTKEVYTNKKRCILVQISGSKGEGLYSRTPWTWALDLKNCRNYTIPLYRGSCKKPSLVPTSGNTRTRFLVPKLVSLRPTKTLLQGIVAGWFHVCFLKQIYFLADIL
jgi:hypothetical protein